MKLLFILHLTMAVAGVLGWGSSFIDRRPEDETVGLHLLRNCLGARLPPPTCRRQRSIKFQRPVLLLNYSATLPSPVTRQLLWVSCSAGMTHRVTLILHERTAKQRFAVLWTLSFRNCSSNPKIIRSTEATVKMGSAGWTQEEVTSESQFELSLASMCSGFELRFRDEDRATPSPKNKACHQPAASVLVPKLSIRLRKQKEGPSDPGIKWIHLVIPAKFVGNGQQGPQVRVDVVVSPSGPSQNILILTSNTSSLEFSLDVSSPIVPQSQPFSFTILSSQSLFLDSFNPADLNISAHSALSEGALRSALDRRFSLALRIRTEYLLEDLLSDLETASGPLGLLLRVAFDTGAHYGSAPNLSDPSARPPRSPDPAKVRTADLLTVACSSDYHMEIEVKVPLAKERGLSMSHFSVKAPICKFKTVIPDKWRLRFRLGDCGSFEMRDPLRSRIVYINTVSLTVGEKSRVLQTITCIKPLQASDPPPINSRVSHTPAIGEKLSINFTSDLYSDFHILACGIYGGKFPIYNIYYENQSIENQLLHFEVLPSGSMQRRQFQLRFKPNYPYGQHSRFRIYCVIEGCPKGSLRKRDTDGALWCSSGQPILRSKILVALILIRGPDPEGRKALSTSGSSRGGLQLPESVCIGAVSFLLGMVTVFSVCFACRRQVPDSRIINEAADL